GAGSSTGLFHRAAALSGESAAATPSGDEHCVQQFAKGRLPPLLASEQHARVDPGTSGRGRSGKIEARGRTSEVRTDGSFLTSDLRLLTSNSYADGLQRRNRAE